MSDIPRSCLRLYVFKTRKEYLVDSCKNFARKPDHNQEEIQDIFDKIKVCFEFYKKSLRDLLKERDIVLYLPTEVLKRAQEENLIQDAEIWLEYIDDLNEIIQSQVPAAAAILRAKVVEKYMDQPAKSWKFVEKFYDEKLIKNVEKEAENAELPDNKPEYKPEEMGLSKFCYDEFINFCKKHKAIRNVWLHGSRAAGNYVETSDIDCLADISEPDEYPQICADLKYLPIPNRIDFAQMKEIKDRFYANVAKNAKNIYRAKDFE